MHFESGVGHIGGNLSCLDLLLGLFQGCLYSEDKFVLSKGHAAGALYVALWASGRLDEELLTTFHKDGTLLAGHPVAGWHPDVLFSTGSLGHGLSLAVGLAHAMQIKGEAGSVYCVVSDGELNEGSIWEAFHYAVHHKLSNLRIIIDGNGLQGFGKTDDILRLGSLPERLAGIGLSVQSIDGHASSQIISALMKPTSTPSVILAETVKGKGVSFMENRMEWHYLPLNEAQYALALTELTEATSRSRTSADGNSVEIP